MNTKTFFSKFPTFSQSWAKYQKKITPLPLGWTVMSDYCLDNPNKNDCITFTICPILGQPEQVAYFLNKKMPRDIKHTQHFSQEECDFIRESKVFFSLVFLIKDKERIVNINLLKEDVKNIKTSLLISEDFRKRMKDFEQVLNRNHCSKKVLQNLSLITFFFGKIVEFLCVKHYTEEIHWFPDRDNVMNIGKGIIKELTNIQCSNALAGRIKAPKLQIGIENPKTQEFIFDPFIRYPDIITGVFSSIDFMKHGVDKEKHAQLLQDVIIDNPRILLFMLSPEEISCMRLRSGPVK